MTKETDLAGDEGKVVERCRPGELGLRKKDRVCEIAQGLARIPYYDTHFPLPISQLKSSPILFLSNAPSSSSQTVAIPPARTHEGPTTRLSADEEDTPPSMGK